jgi:hypothetical protein
MFCRCPVWVKKPSPVTGWRGSYTSENGTPILVADTQGTIQWPFLAIQLFGLSFLFASFGLFAPRNATVIAILFAAALMLAGSVYLIVAMDQPYSGLIKISSEPLRAALAGLGQ